MPRDRQAVDLDVNDPQLAWIAAINGQTPEQYIESQAGYQAQQDATDAFDTQRLADLEQYWRDNPPSTSDTGTEFLIENPRTPEEIRRANEAVTNRLLGREYKSYADVADAYQESTDRADASLDPARTALREGAARDSAGRAQNVQNLDSAFNQATQANAGLFQGMQQSAGRANAQDAATIGQLGQTFARNDAADQSTLGQLQSRYDSYGQLSAGAYQGDAASNPEDIARQMQSYDTLGGWASGANDISSDAGLVGQQQDVYGGFMDYASGANDISSDAGLVGMQQGVYDDYGQFASGAMDLQSQAATATADAEALAAQKEALGEFRERMDPKLTDAERFLYMQSRLSQEQSQRAARDANYRELERRGMGGSTMALSNLNASSAEASNTRALQDLGANAKAVDRAEKALVNYGNMSSTIADQSFQRDFSTKSAADAMAVNNNKQRLAGIAGQGQMATEMRNADDEMRQFNSTQRMQGLQGAGTMATEMRNADDRMRSGNADRRLQGAVQQGQMATEMRNAGDALNMFNKEQQGIHQRHVDDYAAQQQRDAWTRDEGMADARFRTTENSDRRADSFAGRQLTATENQWGRDARTTETGVQMNRDYLTGYDNLVGRDNEARRDDAADRRGNAEFDLGTARLRAEGEGRAIDTRTRQLESDAEDRRAREASTEAQRAAARQREHENSFEQQGILGYIGLDL
jgi:hypothetical protein